MGTDTQRNIINNNRGDRRLTHPTVDIQDAPVYLALHNSMYHEYNPVRLTTLNNLADEIADVHEKVGDNYPQRYQFVIYTNPHYLVIDFYFKNRNEVDSFICDSVEPELEITEALSMLQSQGIINKFYIPRVRNAEQFAYPQESGNGCFYYCLEFLKALKKYDDNELYNILNTQSKTHYGNHYISWQKMPPEFYYLVQDNEAWTAYQAYHQNIPTEIYSPKRIAACDEARKRKLALNNNILKEPYFYGEQNLIPAVVFEYERSIFELNNLFGNSNCLEPSKLTPAIMKPEYNELKKTIQSIIDLDEKPDTIQTFNALLHRTDIPLIKKLIQIKQQSTNSSSKSNWASFWNQNVRRRSPFHEKVYNILQNLNIADLKSVQNTTEKLNELIKNNQRRNLIPR